MYSVFHLYRHQDRWRLENENGIEVGGIESSAGLVGSEYAKTLAIALEHLKKHCGVRIISVLPHPGGGFLIVAVQS